MSYLDDSETAKKVADAIFVAHSLFARGKVTGSTANLSFKHQGLIFVTASGSCFGTLSERDFSVINSQGEVLEGRKPSKEYPLHMSFYKKDEKIGAVLHTHSYYSTLWSCLYHDTVVEELLPKYTPYLAMKLGKVGLIPYAPPGSPELFDLVETNINSADGFLLGNHGPVVPGKDIMDAFYALEELEESCRLAWDLRKEDRALRIGSIPS